ncbi:hypothetical protein NWF34_22520 [Gordonia sp. GONU]|uniref:hypothetical protein n=1 Tax=Gordonia sp. GONU TaxID=2972949 RepID=UPI0021ABC381|nr:hypothetical protein [Gordonia sp. GONU]MCR8899714.1 hypothetical protein [Gordonia sp. GONU]
MTSDLHLIFTNNGDAYGWSLSSPQLPGLAAGRDTLADLLRDTNDILEFADAPITDMWAPGVYLHEEHALSDIYGYEYLVRWMNTGPDDVVEQRIQAASRLESGVVLGYDEIERSRQPVTRTTERLLVALAGTDQMGFVIDELGDDGCATLAKHSGDDVLVLVPFASGELRLADERRSFEELGLGRDSTFDDVVAAVIEDEAKGLHREVAASATKLYPRLTHSKPRK